MNTVDVKEKIRSLVERIERLEEDKKAIADDIKDIYSEAKSSGFDTKALRKLIKIRKQNANERQAEEELLSIYMNALGMGYNQKVQQPVA